MSKSTNSSKNTCCFSIFPLIPIIFSLFFFLLIIFLLFLLSVRPSKKEIVPVINDTSLIKPINIVGVIRTNGLGDEEKKSLVLNTSKYQITDLNNINDDNKILGYFLESKLSEIGKHLGKCVHIKGTIKQGWKDITKNNFQFNQKYTYQNSVLIPSQIKQLDFNKCNPYRYDNSQNITNQNNFRSYRGIIRRINRPSPDINYDYEIILSVSTKEMYGSTGIVSNLTRIDFTPLNNNIWEEMEKRAGKVVTVEGYKTWGYGESEYLLITKIL